MGLILAAKGAISSALADQWKEFFCCDALDGETLAMKGYRKVTRGSNRKGSDNIISDGSKLVVSDGQVLIVVENGCIIDFCAEPGAYTFRTGTEPTVFEGGFEGIKQAVMNAAERFAYGGQAANDQRVYYINAKEIINNKIGIGNVPFRDSEFRFTIKLRGFGTYSYRITNPVLFYQNVCGNIRGVYRREQLDDQLRAELQAAMQPALGRIALKGIPYDQLTLYVKEIAAELNTELNAEWSEKRGITLTTFAFSSVQPDEQSAAKINQFQETRVYTDPSMLGARLGSAQSNAMESAAKNAAGAMHGFMGMNFAAQAGGNAAADFIRMGQENQTKETVSSAPEEKTEKTGWYCPECGHHCTGKFCPECGTKRPASVIYQCNKCGWKPQDPAHPPKFCPNCGDRFTDEDAIG